MTQETLDRWDDDGNTPIDCGELQVKGVETLILTSHPVWPFVKD